MDLNLPIKCSTVQMNSLHTRYEVNFQIHVQYRRRKEYCAKTRGMHKKIYDTDLGYEGIKMGKIKKNAKIFFCISFFFAKKIYAKRFSGYLFSQIMIMSNISNI